MAVNGPRRDPLILCANERGTGEKRESAGDRADQGLGGEWGEFMGSTFRFRIAAGATGGKFQRIPLLFSNIFLFFTPRIGSFLWHGVEH